MVESSKEALAWKIAEVTHAVNNAYRVAVGEPPRKPFRELAETEKRGIFLGVLQHLMNENGIDPRAAHDLWLSNKLKNGWKYGETQDEEAKTHPCLLPYGDLPEKQKVKDYLFSAVVQALRHWN